MVIKQKAIFVCNACGKEIDNDRRIFTEDVPNEGCSTIRYNNKFYDVGNQDYCDFDCLLGDIKVTLGIFKT